MPFKLAALTLRPGFNRDDTEFASEGTFVAGDKARFQNGFAEKLAGWQAMMTDLASGVCRGLFAWADNGGLRWMMAGTNTNLYVTNTETLNDITGRGRVRSLAFGDGKWVAVGEAGEVAYSIDGTTWTHLPDIGFGTSIIRDVAYGNGQWALVGDHAKIAKSTNLADWSIGTIAAFIGTRARATIYSISYDNSAMWVAAGDGGVMVSSTDLTTFTTETSGFGVTTIRRVRHTQQAPANYVWVAVGDGGKIFKSTSTATAMSWSAVTSGITTTLRNLTYNHDVTTWVFVGDRAEVLTATAASPVTLTRQKSTFLAGRNVGIYSSGNLSSLTFTVYGEDTTGAISSEPITGPNNSTVTTVRRFRSVTQVAVSGTVGTNVEVGYTQDRDAIAAAQTRVGAGDLTINGADASGGAVSWGQDDETIWGVGVYRSGSTYWVIAGDSGKLATASGSGPSTWTQVASTTFTQAVYAVRNSTAGLWIAGGENGALATSTDTEGDGGWTARTLGFGEEDAAENAHGAGGPGWGAGEWSEPRADGGGWSDPAAATEIYPRTWSLTQWGQYGIANARFGRIWEWRLDVGVSAQVVSGSPRRSNAVMVTPENVMVSLGNDQTGTFDPMLVSWSDVANNTTWDPQSGNYAGNQRLSEGGLIISGRTSKTENLIWTDTALYSMKFRPGDSDIPYEFALAGRGCGLIGPNAAIMIDGSAFWLARNRNFYIYEGSLPLQLAPNHILNWMYDRLQYVDWEEVHCASIVAKTEVWWWFPTPESEDCSDYVCFNYVDKTWVTGTMQRTAFIDRGIFDLPAAVDWSGQFWWHESGVDDGTAPMDAWVRTAPMDVDEGDRVIRVETIVPDFVLAGAVKFKTYTRRFPMDVLREGTFKTVLPAARKTDLRVEGRQFAFEIRSDTLGADWRVGKLRIGVSPAGKR